MAAAPAVGTVRTPVVDEGWMGVFVAEEPELSCDCDCVCVDKVPLPPPEPPLPVLMEPTLEVVTEKVPLHTPEGDVVVLVVVVVGVLLAPLPPLGELVLEAEVDEAVKVGVHSLVGRVKVPLAA